MKKGDKVVCIKSDKSHLLILNDIYTINKFLKVNGKKNYISLEEITTDFFKSKRFKLLTEIRKEKINSIKHKITQKIILGKKNFAK